MKNVSCAVQRVKRALGIVFLAVYLPVFAGDLPGDSTAQDTALAGFASRYATGSIRSSELADRALADAKQERQVIEARLVAEQNVCYSKFFVTACVDDAKERRHAALELVRQVEIEANAFKRRARVAVSDDELARKREEKQAKAAQRAAAPQQEEAASTDRVHRDGAAKMRQQRSSGVVQPSDTISKRVIRYEAKIARREAKKAADEKKRAENIAAYERKVETAKQRQREIAERKAERNAK